MSNIKTDSDTVCQNATMLFRDRDQLVKAIAEVDELIRRHRNTYRDIMRLSCFSVDHFRQACRARELVE